MRLPRTLHRLSHHPQPWWFAWRRDAGSGRFDLPAPEGTCYLADDLDAALGEVLLRRPRRTVVEDRLRELFHARIAVHDPPRVANLTSPRAARWGVNAEIHATTDYAKPQAWAYALRRNGSPGLRYAVRSDPATGGRAVALFGTAGLHARAPAGMRTGVAPLDAARARRLLEARGIDVVPIPRDVPIVEPRAR